MTTATTEAVEQTDTSEATTEPAGPTPAETWLSTIANDFEQSVYGNVKADVEAFNSKAKEYVAIGGDANELLVNLRESSDDPNVIKIREQLEQLSQATLDLETRRDEILKAEVTKIQENGAGSAEALAAELDVIKARVNPLIVYLEGVSKLKADDLGIKLARRANRSSGVNRAAGSGTGERKVRGYNVSVDGKLATLPNGTGVSSNMAAAAKVMGVDTSVVQSAFWDAQPQGKTTPVADYLETVAFDITNPATGTTHKVTMIKIPKGAE